MNIPNVIKLRICCLAAAALAVTSCAKNSAEIAAFYVPPIRYQSHSCAEIVGEMRAVDTQIIAVSGAQDNQAASDAVLTGVGVIAFWPALFFVGHGDQSAQLSALKGEHNALQSAADYNNCRG